MALILAMTVNVMGEGRCRSVRAPEDTIRKLVVIVELLQFLLGIVITLTCSQEVLTVLCCVPNLDILLSGVDASQRLFLNAF